MSLTNVHFRKQVESGYETPQDLVLLDSDGYLQGFPTTPSASTRRSLCPREE
jgi:hypothetical protein